MVRRDRLFVLWACFGAGGGTMSPYYAVQAVVAFAALVVAFRMGETREAARQQRERDARTDKLYRGVTRNGFVGSGAWPIALPPDPYKASFGPPLHPLADPTFRLVAADDQTAIYLLLRGTDADAR